MSELGSDKNWLELGHVFPEQHSFTRVSHYIYSVLPVSIHEYYVDNIITNMSFPFNLKCKEVVNKNRVDSSASQRADLPSYIYFISKFWFRKQRKSFWTAISSIRTQGSLSDFHLSLIQMGETKAGNGMVKLKLSKRTIVWSHARIVSEHNPIHLNQAIKWIKMQL